MELGKTEKMLIEGFSDENCTKSVTEKYSFLINPDSYNFKYQIDEITTQAAGNKATPPRYLNHQAIEWEFDILFDGTGVVKNATALDISLIGSVTEIKVEDEIKKFAKIAFEYNGDLHRNLYLKVAWGKKDVFKGTLVSVDMNYKLFKPDGTPLRVIAKVRLRGWGDPIQSTSPSSPDITHERTLKAGDKFSLMTNDIYNDPKYYFDVADKNKLDSFRKISIGTKIRFPPLK